MSASIKALALPGIFWGTSVSIKSAKDIYNTIKPLPSVDKVPGQDVFDIMREEQQKWWDHFYKTVLPHSAILLTQIQVR